MADHTLLVLNAGSSSLKFSLFLEADKTLQPVLSGQLEGLNAAPRFHARDAAGTVIGEHRWDEGYQLDHDSAIAYLTDFLRQYRSEHQLIAVGHRVVHGGVEYAAPMRVTAAIVAQLERLVPLAPLHQPHNLTPIKILLQRSPDLPQVACFDTAFHRSQTAIAQAFALPPEITERGVWRYGFHGLSYEYIASVLPDYDAQAAVGRTVVLHLGGGASMCALRAGKSVASTMGFTGVDGLPMGTRCGNLDPGVILYLLDELGMMRAPSKSSSMNNRACSAYRAFPVICAHSKRARTCVRSLPLSCSSTASAVSSAHWWPRSVDWMPWCSPLASASTAR